MSIILKTCFAVFLALLVVAVSVESGPTTPVLPTTEPDESVTPSQTQASTTTVKPVKICDVTFSCGWGIFTQTPYERNIDYFMKNSCECPEGEHCVRVSEDTALSAYIYKCRVKRTTPAPPTEE